MPPSAASGAGPGARWRVILAGIGALVLTVGLARFAYTPLLPVMQAEAGLTALAGGWLATFNYAGYISGALLAATISDLSRKFQQYRIGLVLALLSTGAMGLTDDIYLWVALRFVSGVSSTAGLLIASGPVLNWLMRHGHRPELGLHFAGIGLGIVVSGLAVAAMLHRHHHRQLRRGPGGRRRGDGPRHAVPARCGAGAAAGSRSRRAAPPSRCAGLPTGNLGALQPRTLNAAWRGRPAGWPARRCRRGRRTSSCRRARTSWARPGRRRACPASR